MSPCIVVIAYAIQYVQLHVENQMYTASVNNADSVNRSEDDKKYESIVEK